jgi:pilus assembly protein CpaD
MEKKSNYIISLAILPILAGCMPSIDLQGNDPQAYYAIHPIENKVETRQFVQIVQFAKNADSLSESQLAFLKKDLEQISIKGAEIINLQVSPSDLYKKQRIHYLSKILHGLGYSLPINISSSKDVEVDEVALDITYAAVVTPDCPDWKKSPVTTYSNSTTANFGCADTVNLGLMVDDPHDLVVGKGSDKFNVERSGKVFSDYNSGFGAATAAPSSSTSTSGQ